MRKCKSGDDFPEYLATISFNKKFYNYELLKVDGMFALNVGALNRTQIQFFK